MIIDYKNLSPQIDPSCFIADGAYIIGDVIVAKNVNIWFGAVVRGDVAPIVIGQGTNIQDNSVIHTSRLNGGTIIGENVTIGHGAVIHACTLKNHAFIGMKALIMDKAVVEEFGFVAAGAVVSPGKIVKAKELWAGVPARYIRDLNEGEIEAIKDSAINYQNLAKEYLPR